MSFLYRYPPQSVSYTPLPIQFSLDSVSTSVSRDTVTPASSTPLPVIQLDSSGNVASALTDSELRATPVPVFQSNTLVTVAFDYQEITYVTVGNGIGEIETVTYKSGGAGGTTVATLTMTYDANNKLATVTRS